MRYGFIPLLIIIACGMACSSAAEEQEQSSLDSLGSLAEDKLAEDFSSACQPTGMACSNLQPFGGTLFECSYSKDDAGKVDAIYTESVAELEDVYNCVDVGSPIRNQARFCCAPKPVKTPPFIK